MMVEARLSSLKGIKPHEYAVRFVFGGLCTVLAGLIAAHFGPRVGGLFLAFPAIFPAGASLIEQHEIAHKRKAGMSGQARGRVLAGVDAVGASIASIGLVSFAVIVWKALAKHGSGKVIALATLTWFLVSTALWLLRKSRIIRNRTRHRLKFTERRLHRL